MLTRRSLLAAVPLLASACGPAAERCDAVVLGGGLSGLNTALLLQEQGLKVIVLEANSRVGGRVQTVSTSDGPVDVGASQVGRGYGRVISACSRFGLKLVPEHRDLMDFGFHFEGRWIDPKTWATSEFNTCVGAERAIPPMFMGPTIVSRYNPLAGPAEWLDPRYADQDISLRALMQREGYSPQAIQLAALSAPGISIDGTSVLRMWHEEARSRLERSFGATTESGPVRVPFGEEQELGSGEGLALISNIEGGCENLPKAMAAALGDAVRLGKVVGRVEMDDARATVVCRDGGAYVADFVVSALPFSVLRDVEIVAKPNATAQQAIAQMPYANTARLYATLDRPFWEDDGMPASFTTDGPMGMFWAVKNAPGSDVRRAMFVLVGLTGQAIASRPNPEAFLLAELEKLRPASKGAVRIVTYKDWASDPLQKGCGFSLAPGQVNAFARDMLTPWQRMHFAGEHTRRADFGMESAMESSERVALEILERA